MRRSQQWMKEYISARNTGNASFDTNFARKQGQEACDPQCQAPVCLNVLG